jgi:hypothetical protein
MNLSQFKSLNSTRFTTIRFTTKYIRERNPVVKRDPNLFLFTNADQTLT